MNIKRINTFIVTLLFSFVITGCSDDDEPITTSPVVTTPTPTVTTVVDTAVANGSFTTLVAALKATGLDATLADPAANFTVFAPTDAAFARLGQDTINALLADTEKLSKILTYHVLNREVNAAGAIASAGDTITTVNGADLGLSLEGDQLLVNTATVTSTDIVTDNGIIHVIDAVLMPPAESMASDMNLVETAMANGNFTTLLAALKKAGLDTALADEQKTFTVFAPTDAAFAMIDSNLLDGILNDQQALTAILQQHVITAEVDSINAYALNGKTATTLSGAAIPVMINSTTDKLSFGGANIISKDIHTKNGIIHVLDMVVTADVTLPKPLLSVADIAAANGNFTTLVAALKATNLDSVLDDANAKFTVFAPSDAAFALLGQDTINALLADPETLANILLYHVISGAEVKQDDAVSLAQTSNNKVAMANKQQAALSYVNSNLFINQSAVSTPNVMADNGVIHVIDQVILPPKVKAMATMNIAEEITADANFSTLLTALNTANLAATFADENKTFTLFAPTNRAFDKLADSALANLLADNQALTQVLLQHVIADSEVDSISAFAANGGAVDTLANNDISLALVNFAAQTANAADEVAYNANLQLLVGGANSNKAGFTLYVFDNDLGFSSSQCNDTCAANWPPVLISDGNASSLTGVTVIDRDDGSKQAAFNGRPLYFFAGDMKAGDSLGDGVNNVWHRVEQQQVSLQVQGANVTMFDRYTKNGVIHVIDSVITETLNK